MGGLSCRAQLCSTPHQPTLEQRSKVWLPPLRGSRGMACSKQSSGLSPISAKLGAPAWMKALLGGRGGGNGREVVIWLAFPSSLVLLLSLQVNPPRAMTSTSQSPRNLSSRFAIATLSLGSNESHSLESKLGAAAKAGFTSVELFVADWEKYLELYLQEHSLPLTDQEGHWEAAQHLRSLLDSLGLRVNVLQPIRNIEGLADPAERRRRFKEVHDYLKICNILDIDLILICSSIDESSSGDVAVISKDLVELADMATAWHKENGGKLIRIAYEG